MPSSTQRSLSDGHELTPAPFGRTSEGQAVELFTLTNIHGIEVRLTNYGGIITSLKTPDRSGRFDDIVLGYDSLSGYLHDSPYFGAIVGRYGNRIARGRFTLDGTIYRLAVNNGPNSLHGGLRGFDKVVWNANPFRSEEGTGVALDYTSADMEEGYPGTLRASVTYTLTDADRLIVDYQATSDKPTPVNLTQHSYWNLAGDGTRDILGHELTIYADSMTPVDSTLIPTGEISPVAGTPFDFRTPMPIGARIDQRQNTQIRYGGGYDHNFVLNRGGNVGDGLVHAARVAEPTTGRTLDISTTEPGIQFYSGNFLDGSITGKAGHVYRHRYGLALETQHYPDSPNHPNFPSTILRPGQQYRSRTIFAFGVARTETHAPARAVWTRERARAWADSTGWLVGSNFIPSTAINQLEMWQAATFDPRTIDRELGWAETLGFNTMRVFLHHLLWQQDSIGFLNRVDQFLTIADRHHVRPMFVLFDAVWDPMPHLGPQRAPIPHVHNSGWVQSPGVVVLSDTARFEQLRGYVQGVVGRFAKDRRVVAWDVFNEPDNTNRPAYVAYEPLDKGARSFILLRKAFAWAREMNPSQPLTAAPWKGDWIDPNRLDPLTAYMLDSSDVITFHSYDDSATVERLVTALEQYGGGRPIICSEYMARPRGSTFKSILPIFAGRRIGGYNWGFVAGKTQTIYPWDSWYREYTTEPKVWFHDIFRSDGTPYSAAEVAFIRALTTSMRLRGLQKRG